MEFGLGVLHWDPDRFWRATFFELSCAYIGHCRSNGVGKWARRPDGWTRAEIDEHREQIDALRDKYPDGPTPLAVAKQWKKLRREFEKAGGQCPKPSTDSSTPSMATLVG